MFSTFSGSISTKIYASGSESQDSSESQESIDKDTKKYFVMFSHKGCNYTINFNELIENETDEKLVIQLIEIFKEVMDPYDNKIPKDKSKVFTCQKGSKFYEKVKEISLAKSPEEREKKLEDLLDYMSLVIAFSYRGYNYILNFIELVEKGLDKEEAMRLANIFRRVVNPYNKTIPEYKGLCYQLEYSDELREFIKEISLAKSPEEQEKSVKDYLDDLILKVICSYRGSNFELDFTELVEKGLDKGVAIRLAEIFRRVLKPFDITIPGYKGSYCKFVYSDELSGFIKNIFSAKSPEEQEKLVKDYLDETMLRVNCSYKGFNFKLRFTESVKKGLDKEAAIRLAETFRRALKPFDITMSEHKVFYCKFVCSDEFCEFIKGISLAKSPEEQEKLVKDYLDDLMLRFFCSYKGFNMILKFGKLVKNGVDENLVVQFVEKLKEITKDSPWDVNISKDNIIIHEYMIPDEFIKWAENVSLAKSPEEQKKLIQNGLDNLILKFNGSYRGLNFKLDFTELVEKGLDKEAAIRLAEIFRRLLKPYDKTLPEYKEWYRKFAYTDESREFIKNIFSAKSPEEQEKLVKDHLDELMLKVNCSYKGFNFKLRFTESIKKGSDKEAAFGLAEVFRRVLKPYDKTIPKNKKFYYKFAYTNAFIGFIKEMSLAKSLKEQGKLVKDYLDDLMLKVSCSYGGFNMILKFSKLVENGVDENLVIQFVEKLREIMKNNPWVANMPKDNIIIHEYITPDEFIKWAENVSSAKSPEEQKKLIQNGLDKLVDNKLNTFFKFI